MFKKIDCSSLAYKGGEEGGRRREEEGKKEAAGWWGERRAASLLLSLSLSLTRVKMDRQDGQNLYRIHLLSIGFNYID